MDEEALFPTTHVSLAMVEQPSFPLLWHPFHKPREKLLKSEKSQTLEPRAIIEKRKATKAKKRAAFP